MKRLISLVIIVIFAFSLCACNSSDVNDEHNHDHDHTNAVEVTDSVQETTEAQTQTESQPFTEIVTVVAEGPLGSKHSGKIDVPFSNEYNQAKTDEEREAVCDKYREEWEKIANRYVNELLNYKGDVPVHPDFSTDEELHECVGYRKGDFVTYFESGSRAYLLQMEEQHGKGDKANALTAKYEFDMQRTFALEMIEIYELIGEFNGQEY